MKTITIIPLLFVLLILACNIIKPLNQQEITSMEDNLDELQIEIDYEINDLRIDIIRQTTEVCDDSTTYDENVPYHPLGFNLGNGLFFDLNENLSLRIDDLFSIGRFENFELKKMAYYTVVKNTTSYQSRSENEYCRSWNGVFGKERNYCVQNKINENEVTVFHKNNPIYTILKEGNKTLFCRGKKNTIRYTIEKEDDNKYVIPYRKRIDEFALENNRVFLSDRYIVEKDEIDGSISIIAKGKKRNFLLYKIKKNSEKIFVYNRNYFGYKIELSSSVLALYQNDFKFCDYQRL